MICVLYEQARIYIPVIYGFGVSIYLKPLALKAIAASNASNTYGILKSNTTWAYYHSFSSVYRKQQEWVNIVSQQFNNTDCKVYNIYIKTIQQ